MTNLIEMNTGTTANSVCGEGGEDDQLKSDKLEPIAVIGFALKFPQEATSPEEFWQMLLQGRSAMTEVPKDRWNIDAFYHPNPDKLDFVSLPPM